MTKMRSASRAPRLRFESSRQASLGSAQHALLRCSGLPRVGPRFGDWSIHASVAAGLRDREVRVRRERVCAVRASGRFPARFRLTWPPRSTGVDRLRCKPLRCSPPLQLHACHPESPSPPQPRASTRACLGRAGREGAALSASRSRKGAGPSRGGRAGDGWQTASGSGSVLASATTRTLESDRSAARMPRRLTGNGSAITTRAGVCGNCTRLGRHRITLRSTSARVSALAD